MKYLNIMKIVVDHFYANEVVGKALSELAGWIDDQLVHAFYDAMGEAEEEVTEEDEANFREWLADHKLDGQSHIDAFLKVLV
jgi:hypothetical protein